MGGERARLKEEVQGPKPQRASRALELWDLAERKGQGGMLGTGVAEKGTGLSHIT